VETHVSSGWKDAHPWSCWSLIVWLELSDLHCRRKQLTADESCWDAHPFEKRHGYTPDISALLSLPFVHTILNVMKSFLEAKKLVIKRRMNRPRCTDF
jgi:hypothetical protein